MDKKNKHSKAIDPNMPTFEDKRNTVLEHELNARFWKATYDVMYYTLEAENIKPQYADLLEKQRLEQQERIAKVQKAQEEVLDINEKLKQASELTIEQLKNSDNGSGQEVGLSIDTANIQGS